jgi:hypothetical protein
MKAFLYREDFVAKGGESCSVCRELSRDSCVQFHDWAHYETVFTVCVKDQVIQLERRAWKYRSASAVMRRLHAAAGSWAAGGRPGCSAVAAKRGRSLDDHHEDKFNSLPCNISAFYRQKFMRDSYFFEDLLPLYQSNCIRSDSYCATHSSLKDRLFC